MTDDLDVSPEVSAAFCAGALDRIPEVPTIDTREDLQRRLDEMRSDKLGRRVREVWVEWASRQPNPKPSHLVPWEHLDAGNREVDRLIGEALATEGRLEANDAITWFTTCLNCSTLMDSVYAETMRAEKAEAALADAVALAEELLGGHCRVCSHNMRLERARAALGQGAD